MNINYHDILETKSIVDHKVYYKNYVDESLENSLKYNILNSKSAFIIVGDYNENLSYNNWIQEFKVNQESCRFNQPNNINLIN